MPRALVPMKMPAKAVLLRTRGFLEMELELEDDVIEAMRENGSLDTHITDGQWDNIESMEIERRPQYINDLLLTRNEDAIQRFITALGKHIHTARFSDMLKYEVLNERGELKPDNIKMEEAAMIVHRQFGTSRRLSQFEKKLLQKIVAQKTQIYDRMFKREVQRLNGCIAEEKIKSQQKDQYSRELAEKLKQFFMDHSAKLRELDLDNSQGSRTASEYGLTKREYSDPEMGDLETDIVGALEFARKALLEMDSYKDEKNRAVDALGRFSKSKDAPLDDQIQDALDQCARELIETKTAVSDRAGNLSDLSYSLDGLKEVADQTKTDRGRQIEKLRQDLEDTSAKLQHWTQHTADMRDQVRARNEELDDWRSRLELLDRGKRLKKIHYRDGYTLEGELAAEAGGVIQDIQTQKALERAPENLGPVISSRRYNGAHKSHPYGADQTEPRLRSNGFHSRDDSSRNSQSSTSGNSSVSSISSRSSAALSRRSTQSLPPLTRKANGFMTSLEDSDRFE